MRARRRRTAGWLRWLRWPRWPRWPRPGARVLAVSLGLGLGLGLIPGLVAWRAVPGRAAIAAPAGRPAPPPTALPAGARGRGVGAPMADGRGRQRRQLLERLERADLVYCSYRSASRYPAGSRPMRENADQNHPNDAIASTTPLRSADGGAGDASVRLQTAQSRIWVAAGEAVTFSLRAIDADGQVLPLVVTRALAQGITYAGTRPTPSIVLPFAESSGASGGSGAGGAAGDGSLAAVLAPGQTALAGFDGTIRTEVRYNAAGRNGVVQFDVIHTPALPAVWAGPVTEAVEDGSLTYRLPLDVRQPGRYVVNGRVDDARGRPLALLTFNDVLGPGPNEIRLTVFGKLLRDAAPAQPLTLRDVDGWLLKENTDPDRAMLARREGRVFSGQAHDGQVFSDAEWQSEERSRYLREFARDLDDARARLTAFDPAAPLPAGACPAPPQ